MPHLRLLWSFLFVVGLTILPIAAPAKILPHYYLDSLTYMSTDIVTAMISDGSPQQITTTVDDVLYGGLKPSERPSPRPSVSSSRWKAGNA